MGKERIRIGDWQRVTYGGRIKVRAVNQAR
jgi:hypothetical protein